MSVYTLLKFYFLMNVGRDMRMLSSKWRRGRRGIEREAKKKKKEERVREIGDN